MREEAHLGNIVDQAVVFPQKGEQLHTRPIHRHVSEENMDMLTLPLKINRGNYSH
jgi:hypothetical protein